MLVVSEIAKVYFFAQNASDEYALNAIFNEMFIAGLRVTRGPVDDRDNFTCVELVTDNVDVPR